MTIFNDFNTYLITKIQRGLNDLLRVTDVRGVL